MLEPTIKVSVTKLDEFTYLRTIDGERSLLVTIAGNATIVADLQRKRTCIYENTRELIDFIDHIVMNSKAVMQLVKLAYGVDLAVICQSRAMTIAERALLFACIFIIDDKNANIDIPAVHSYCYNLSKNFELLTQP